ncbi:hypothetical protein PFICI_15243 [Pestalotiopsis fici W106-1]|uniref:AB hydrolase-1 domain-containing protein n=1 Tax=Pestalotiopsis fici (strain W106-1 / CGMCC3.15140) TaxID=1229662 RepID=W3WGN5_PESFW|nr:uncharacterized protein PFICI_15243 [Pestalotiopsis fici W106-1]ETS73068.1 hypothetical protein PFICI_15243 [Pestalotiopsis fici W106-1]
MVPAPNPPVCDDTKATIFGNTPNPHPVVICFHGSGDSCASWLPLAHSLSDSYRVLLWDRGEPSQKPSVAVDEMVKYLEQVRLQIPPPYVLVAHSYGGTFARTFLEKRPRDVAGMVLAETGQETALDAKMERQQYRRQVLGDNPLSVIRANTLIRKWAQYEHAVNAADNDTEKTALEVQKQILDVTDKEDERLKKAQLALSRHHRYLHVPDCGHNVIQDRPEVVADEIRWVMKNLVSTEKKPANVLRRLLSLIGSRRQPQ